MNDALLQLFGAFLEQLFIAVLMTALLNQRSRIGSAAMMMCFCAALLFGALTTGADIQIKLPWGGGFDAGRILVSLPLLCVFLMVYIIEGTLFAQRLLMGVCCSYLFYMYFGVVIKIQCGFLPESNFRALLYTLLDDGKAAIYHNAVADMLAFFTVPIFYGAINTGKRFFLRIFASLCGAQLVSIIPGLLLLQINRDIARVPWGTVYAAVISTGYLSVLMYFYMRKLFVERPARKAGAFDFFFAFFGSYSRIRSLEEDLKIWESRYKLILRHSAEIIVVCDDQGKVVETNIACEKIFKRPINGEKFFDMLSDISPEDTVLGKITDKPCYFDCRCGERILSASLSPINLPNNRWQVFVARDVTSEKLLALEKEELSRQLIHSQRMESLGVLAGGIAHDFNNCIHAIMGHADLAQMMYLNDREKISGTLHKISSIAEKAGKLTSQLLGFARKGKYNVVTIDLKDLLKNCTELLDPFRVAGAEIKMDFPEEKLLCPGDSNHLQQVVLNLLINALDAVAGNAPEDKKICLSAGNADKSPLGFLPPPDFAGESAENYIYFAIADNGCGMDEETRRKIFEPFFTTKPIGSGTGMGLAMVYGTVNHHKGWIQLDSGSGEGTIFAIYLPRSNG